MKVLIVANTAWHLCNYREGLIRSLIDSGYEVNAVASPDGDYRDQVDAMGCRFFPCQIDGKGMNPFADTMTIIRLWRILRRERPSAILSFTPKGNIFAGLCAFLLRIPIITNVTLGIGFERKGLFRSFMRFLYRISHRQAGRVFFQNAETRALFVSGGVVKAEQAQVLPGSGVHLGHFTPAPLPSAPPARFLFIGRLIQQKGIAQYVEAARIIRAKYPETRFSVVGPFDDRGTKPISRSTFDAWIVHNDVEYLGFHDDIRSIIASVHCVVLPTHYLEGVPRCLLEAAAMGRPIITTNWPGCRDAVIDGQSGLLCKPRDAGDLAAKLMTFLELGPNRWAEMGQCGRRRMETQFDERLVIAQYRAALQLIGAARGGEFNKPLFVEGRPTRSAAE